MKSAGSAQHLSEKRIETKNSQNIPTTFHATKKNRLFCLAPLFFPVFQIVLASLVPRLKGIVCWLMRTLLVAYYLVVSTHQKSVGQIGSSPRIGPFFEALKPPPNLCHSYLSPAKCFTSSGLNLNHPEIKKITASTHSFKTTSPTQPSIPIPSMGRLYIYPHEWLIFNGFSCR